MALTLGTNCGFVIVAPTADPAATNVLADTRSNAGKDTAPAGAIRIVEMGWWCDNATEEANFEVGVYSDSAAAPNSRLFVSPTNAKGTGAGWKTVTGLDWSITPGTVYWLAVQLDDTATATNTNNAASGGSGYALDATQTTLTDPWGTSDSTDADGMIAIYARWIPAASLVAPKGVNNAVLLGRLAG